MTEMPVRFLFVGGPGRSGTSHMSRQLGTHPEICGFPDVELKIVAEKGGLVDLHHSLVLQYSPNRATVALQQFRRMAHAVLEGQYGQPALSTLVQSSCWIDLFEEFLYKLAPSGHAMPASTDVFAHHARGLMLGIASLAAGAKGDRPENAVFLEKTPHNLLAADFIEQVLPGSRYLHVMRDPRAIAFSLQRMRWGPDSLKACCDWVASYCQTFKLCLEQDRTRFPQIREVFIEDVVLEPGQTATELTEWLVVSPMGEMLSATSQGILNAWESACSVRDRELLDTSLRGCAIAFGYDAEEIGARTSSSKLPAVASASGQ